MESANPTIDRAALAIAATLLAIALVILWDAMSLPAPVYGIGPRAMPIIVAVGLILLATGNAYLAWRGYGSEVAYQAVRLAERRAISTPESRAA